MSLALVGRNLMLWADVPNIDPETALNSGNAQGFEWGQLPVTAELRPDGLDHPRLLTQPNR